MCTSEDASGNPVYEFKIFDGIFEALKTAGVRPMIELGFMPKDLAAEAEGRHEPYQVHYPKSTVSGASNNPPKNYRKWSELVRAVTSHLTERYGRETVLGWYFEVWNEPDIDYWHSSPQDYWKLYDYAVAGVRAALPGARVGGPASTGPGGPKAAKFFDDFLAHADHGKSAANGEPVPQWTTLRDLHGGRDEGALRFRGPFEGEPARHVVLVVRVRRQGVL